MKKDFLSIADFDQDKIFDIFELTQELKEKTKKHKEHSLLKGCTLAMIFAKPSARTRISFETGIYQLGGSGLYLAPTDIGLGKREAIKDIAQVIARYNDLIMARLFDHNDILELAQYATVPVINGLTDYNHPCQIMADAYTIREHFGRIEKTKITYLGDGNNIANSWLNFASRVPIELVICTPSNYQPDKATFENAVKSGKSSIHLESDPKKAVKDADILYTDVWASMGQEAETEQRKKVFKPYQLNSELLKIAKKNAIVLHCLPAHRGDEITDEVIDGPQSFVYDEAENRLHVQKAIMVKLLR